MLNSQPDTDAKFTIESFSSLDDLYRVIFDAESHERAVDLAILGVGSSTCVRTEVEEVMRRLGEHKMDIPVVVLSECRDRRDIFEAFRCGVRGYIHASMNFAQIMDALRLVLHGGVFIPECVLTDEGLELETCVQDIGATPVVGVEQPDYAASARLTPRQRDVLNLLRKGMSNRVIAEELKMREGTVKVHVAHIMRKLHARNRTHAAFLADQNALLDDGKAAMR